MSDNIESLYNSLDKNIAILSHDIEYIRENQNKMEKSFNKLNEKIDNMVKVVVPILENDHIEVRKLAEFKEEITIRHAIEDQKRKYFNKIKNFFLRVGEES